MKLKLLVCGGGFAFMADVPVPRALGLEILAFDSFCLRVFLQLPLVAWLLGLFRHNRWFTFQSTLCGYVTYDFSLSICSKRYFFAGAAP